MTGGAVTTPIKWPLLVWLFVAAVLLVRSWGKEEEQVE